MKTNLLKTLLAGALLLCGVSVNAQELLDKFYVGVTGYDQDEKAATIDATVYEDWSFVVGLAPKTSVVGADKAKVNIYMQKVGTLGVTDKRQHEVTLSTDVSGVWVSLGDYLSNAYNFTGATCPVKVIDNDTNEEQNFTYNIAATTDNKIVGTPNSVDNARLAWHMITDRVVSGTKETEDSYLTIMNGTYIQLGDERVTFNQTYDFLKGAWTISGTISKVSEITDLTDAGVSGAKTAQLITFLPAGTTLAIGSSYAELQKDAKITFDASAAYSGSEFTGYLSGLKTEIEKSNKAGLLKAIRLFNDLIGLANLAGNVPATVEFSPKEEVEEAMLLVYPGSKRAISNQTVAQFQEIQKTSANAIALAESKYASQLLGKGYTNIVIAYAAGQKGTYYECEKLELKDPSQTGKPYDQANYYFPYNFVALDGSYTCAATRRNNMVCVPFALDAASTSSSAKLLTFAYYEPIYENGEQKVNSDGSKAAYAYFNVNDVIPAGEPCLIYDDNKGGISATFDNTPIVGTPNNSTNLKGAFATTSSFYGNGFYTVSSSNGTEKLAKAPATLNPFRACLELAYDSTFDGGNNHDDATSGAKMIDIAIIGANGEATTIDGVSLGNVNAKDGIYTINGTKVSDMSKPGLYIVNGVKKFVK